MEKLLTRNNECSGKMATGKYRMPRRRCCLENSECPREDGDRKIKNALEKMLTRKQ
jgi:hypothetical protein